MTVVTTAPADHIALLTIDDVANRNALTAPTLAGLRIALIEAGKDDAVRAVVITGAERMFSAGGDTNRMGSTRLSPLGRKAYLEQGVGQLAGVLSTYDKPLYAAINGPAIGAGMDLALWCDFRFASANAYLRGGYIDLALPPGFGAAWLLRQLVGPTRSLDILLSGRTVGADEALRLGLIERVTAERGELLDVTLAHAALIAAKSPAAVRLTKRLVRQAGRLQPTDVLDLASSHYGVLQEEPEHAEAVRALREQPR